MPKILIVEDEKMLSEMYSDKLNQEGLDVAVANDTEEAREQIAKNRPDLIILDILLPRENGLDFLRFLKSSLATKDIKVIAFSNYDVPETKAEAYRLGAIDYMIKTNYTPHEVVKRIKELLYAKD